MSGPYRPMIEPIIDILSVWGIDIGDSGSSQYTPKEPPHRKLRYLPSTGAADTQVAAGPLAANAATQASTVTVSVGAGSGASLADSFTGFSFEANVLAGTAPSAGNLYQYLKTLGSGVMRFGGNFVDTTFWTSKGEAQPSWAVATLTPADLQRLRTLAPNSGRPVVLRVNLKQRDPARAADEAKFAKQILTTALTAIALGGEGNSVSCEGMDGVSDVFAAGLWGVDAQLLYAREGLKGFYMHSSIATCGAPKPLYKAYTPFCAPTDADAAAGNLRVRPVYYSSLLLQQLGSGAFAPVTNRDLTD